MNKSKFKGLLKSAKQNLGKHSPQILMGIGIAGMVTSTILAVKATPKALDLIAEAKEVKTAETMDEESGRLTPIETVKAAWKPYVPAIVTGALSVGCLIGANNVSARRMTAVTAAYKLSEAALSEYKDAVIETIGEKKEKQVKEKVAKKQIEKHPMTENTEVYVTGGGNTLCLDALSGRYFRSDIDKIKKAENKLNLQLRNMNYISLNSFYDMIDSPQLKHTDLGDELGWNIDADGYVDIELTAQIADSGEPCIVLSYNVMPRYDYYKMGY